MNKTIKDFKNKSFIIEFNGLPGCGKSTIVKDVIEELTSQGYLVLNFNCFLSKIKRNKRIILSALFKLRFKQIIFLLRLLRYVYLLKIKKAFIIKFSLALIRNYSLLSYCHAFNKYDYILLDQGIIQDMASIARDKKIDELDIIQKIYMGLLENFPGYLMVNADTTDINIKKRLASREKGTSLLDRVEKKYLDNLINIQRYNFALLRRMNIVIPSINIDTSNDINKNTKIICTTALNYR